MNFTGVLDLRLKIYHSLTLASITKTEKKKIYYVHSRAYLSLVLIIRLFESKFRVCCQLVRAGFSGVSVVILFALVLLFFSLVGW